jgi:hypothetical protein
MLVKGVIGRYRSLRAKDLFEFVLHNFIQALLQSFSLIQRGGDLSIKPHMPPMENQGFAVCDFLALIVSLCFSANSGFNREPSVTSMLYPVSCSRMEAAWNMKILKRPS